MSALQFLPAIEMLVFNVLTVGHCCHRKYSAIRTFFVFGLFTALLFLISIRLPGGPFWQNSELALLGFFYIIPLRYLYKEKTSLLLVIMCICWTYTMGVHTLSLQIARLITSGSLLPYYLLTESLLFIGTMLPFYRQIVPKFAFILNNIDTLGKQWYKYLSLSSCLGFASLFLLNAAFTEENASLLKCFILVLLLSSLYVTNYILYHIVLDCIRMNVLEYTSSHDMLTGLGNRAGLLKHMQSLIRTDQVFSVLFMDLDRFKMVNDQYGHVVGDQYLIHFSKICSRILQNNGKVFRFGGDEFVGLYYGIVPAGTVKQLEECREWDEGAPCPFNQVSVGVLPCRPPHKNIDEILQQADAVMYKAKWSKPGEK